MKYVLPKSHWEKLTLICSSVDRKKCNHEISGSNGEWRLHDVCHESVINSIFQLWAGTSITRCIAFAIFLVMSSQATSNASEESSLLQVSDELRNRAVEQLQSSLRDQPGSVKVHAAESLIALSHDQDVLTVFLKELDQVGNQPKYRIGIWGVLAEAAPTRASQSAYLELLRHAYLTPHSPDSAQAAEALAKLRYQIDPMQRADYERAAENLPADGLPYARWLLAASGTERDLGKLTELLHDQNPEVRGAAAYALRHLRRTLPPEIVDQIAKAADSESESAGRVYLLSAAFTTASDPHRIQRLKELLLPYAKSGDQQQKYEAISALAIRGDKSDLPLLVELLSDPAADVRVAAATAVLRIDRRRPTAFKVLDWIVLTAYGVGMLLVGWFYSRVKNVEEYLLGSRSMKPWAVGISLFATLMSTLTYLSVPGEMIRHGPMILGGILSYPLVYLVVGRYIIPFIMKLRVTSAYEILEQRFGLSVRMLGSTLFLTLRLLWMALIVYATSSEVVVPLLGLDASATPWACAIMALVTIAYTSIGGLQAVVFTDVLQTFIMLAGALISIILITVSLGGVTAWWPTSWSPQWDPPNLFFASESRISVGLAMLSYLIWYICTAGSDQMAIQRYLATRDANAAKRMFGMALCCSAVVAVLLAALGLAMFAYFSAHPAILPDGATLASGADQLLPQFIVRVLPAGISGLIVAGILSAAMDSLSSGVNSSCSVITVDWIDRFRRVKLHGQAHVREAVIISWLVGVIVVLLSLFASFVPGNLLEKCYTVVNLFTAPLFVLFFMAMFVSWATVFGTWLAAILSVAIAIAMAYGNFLGLSFLWITPVSLIVGICVGLTASLLPIGRRRPLLRFHE